MNTFGQRLKLERERLGLSQDALAKMVDPTKGQSFISNFETGARQGTALIVELAHALGVDAYWLKTGKGQRQGQASALAPDELDILAAYRLFGPELKENWRDAARKKLEEAEHAKNKAA